MRLTALLLTTALMTTIATAQTKTTTRVKPAPLPEGYWQMEKTTSIVEKTQTVRLQPNLSGLTAGEKKALENLIQVGELFQEIYEESRHHQALTAKRRLEALSRTHKTAATANLKTMYRTFQGPIATTLDNKREPFLPVDPTVPGRNVYPWGITAEEINAFIRANPDQESAILHPRSVVRRATARNLQRDIAALKRYPVLETLHPGLLNHLGKLSGAPNSKTLYAVPYSVAYAERIIKAHALLNEAADALEKEDFEFAAYLRNRSRDLLSDDYESGDAAWITGRFKNLNAQIGSYENYDDALMGVKTFFAVSLLLNDVPKTEQLRKALQGMQAIENSLPYKHQKKVKEDIPVSIYDVIADFGQARGGNTATILPNENLYARRYGRIILMRSNIIRHPDTFEDVDNAWEAAVAPKHADELTVDGNFYRTLWHEIGHYLGVDADKRGRDLDSALQDVSAAYEEMKADLVSLYAAPALQKQGYYTPEQLRAVYASGIKRVLQDVKPRKDQPYQTMQLMQWNYFLEHGLLTFDTNTKKLTIHYEKYPEVVSKMLADVLEIQYQGDKAAADAYMAKYTTWDENLHGAIAANIRAKSRYRFANYTYAALGE